MKPSLYHRIISKGYDSRKSSWKIYAVKVANICRVKNYAARKEKMCLFIYLARRVIREKKPQKQIIKSNVLTHVVNEI